MSPSLKCVSLVGSPTDHETYWFDPSCVKVVGVVKGPSFGMMFGLGHSLILEQKIQVVGFLGFWERMYWLGNLV